jgi:uncharacterized membrane protein YbhN (UPF0104 family)
MTPQPPIAERIELFIWLCVALFLTLDAFLWAYGGREWTFSHAVQTSPRHGVLAFLCGCLMWHWFGTR